MANRLAQPLYDKYAGQVVRLAAKPDAGQGEVSMRVLATQADELAWLADEVEAAHEAGAKWSDVGVLTRDNAHAADVFDALTARDVPVEIVGLSGLIRLPEVAEVVATLHLLNDVTANAALLTLLTGPRWAIGPRDLRLLGRRAAAPGGRRGLGEAETLGDQLIGIADGIDPAEIAALGDALDSPGDAAYSPEALDRFALLSAELRMLRRAVGEPLLDVVRRIIDTSGVDIELASAVSSAASARRDNLDLFVKAVAEFQAVDGDVSLSALLAYLTAEDDQGNGLDLATPTAADSVKLLTVHRAKGLEWAHVFLVGVCETRFPSNRSRTLWTSSPAVLPAPLRGDARDLPQLAGTTRPRSTPTARTPAPTTRRRSCGWATSPSPAPRTASACRRTSGARGPRPTDRRPTRAWSATSSTPGASRCPRGTGWRSRPRATPTRTTPSTRPARGPSPARAARRPCASRPRAWWSRPTRRPTTTTSTWSRPPGSPTGTSSSTASSPRRGPTATRWSTCRCRRRCRRPRSRGCARSPRPSPATWPGRCPASRRRPRGSAPASTRGSRHGSASRTSSTPTSCPVRPTPASTPTTTSPS